MAQPNPKFCLLALLVLASIASAGVYISPSTVGPLTEGRDSRVAIGTYWADVRAYLIEVETGFAVCSGTEGPGRTCGPCPLTGEYASFIVTWWNGTQTKLDNIREGNTSEVPGQFKIRVKSISELLFVENKDSGLCSYRDEAVLFEFTPYVECNADGDCPNGKGCADYRCVSVDCSSNSNCAADEHCVNRQCYTVPTGPCGHIENHEWIDYECCQDSDCESGKVCARNICRIYRLCSFDIDCGFDEYCNSTTKHCEYIPDVPACGRYADHAWLPYECCNSTDCGAGNVCNNHVCAGCATNDDCAGNQFCQGSVCTNLTGCGRIANHTFTRYECCNDTECFDEFACISNRCSPVICPCGSITNHVCIPCSPTPTPVPTATPEITPTPDVNATAAPSPTPTPTPTPTPAPSPTPYYGPDAATVLLATICPFVIIILFGMLLFALAIAFIFKQRKRTGL